MRWIKSLCVCAASLMIAGSVIAWAEPPTSQPAGMDQQDPKSASAERGGSGRWGFAPFNKLSNVTDEQKQKISTIHAKANAEIKAIKEKEEADIMALLTDEQKAELDKMEADKKSKAAEKRAEKKEKKSDDSDKDK
ncbi:MAG: hypothetical protein H7Z14_17820 [Anaerolineae bacterium]|nr:hypothetical protein [Phycisphaerae bacterium]